MLSRSSGAGAGVAGGCEVVEDGDGVRFAGVWVYDSGSCSDSDSDSYESCTIF